MGVREERGRAMVENDGGVGGAGRMRWVVWKKLRR